MSSLKEGDRIIFTVQGNDCHGKILAVGEEIVVVKWDNGNIVDVTHRQAEKFRIEHQ